MEENKEINTLEESEVLYKAKSKITKENYIKFNNFHLKKKNVAISVIFYVCIVIIYIAAISLLLMREHIFEGILYFIFATFFLLWQIFLPKIFVNRILKTDKITGKTENEFKFGKEKFSISNEYGMATISYTDLHRIYETNEFYYLYLNNRQAYIVEKQGLRKEEIEGISNIFKDALGKSYILK